MTLANVADEIQHRLIHIFARDNDGNRACNGGSVIQNRDPFWRVGGDVALALTLGAGAISSPSTSSSTRTAAKDSAPRTRRAGPASWPT